MAQKYLYLDKVHHSQKLGKYSSKKLRNFTSSQSEWQISMEQATKMLEGMQRTGRPYPLLVGLKTGAATIQISMENYQKAKNVSTTCFTHTIPQLVPKGPDFLHHRYLLSHFYCCSTRNSQEVEITKMSYNRFTDNENVVHKYCGLLFSCKESEYMKFAATWTAVEQTLLYKVSRQAKRNAHGFRAYPLLLEAPSPNSSDVSIPPVREQGNKTGQVLGWRGGAEEIQRWEYQDTYNLKRGTEKWGSLGKGRGQIEKKAEECGGEENDVDKLIVDL